MITKEQIESRMASLVQEQKQLQETYEQMGRNLNAYSGAIEDCKFWLEQLGKEPPVEKEKVK